MSVNKGESVEKRLHIKIIGVYVWGGEAAPHIYPNLDDEKAAIFSTKTLPFLSRINWYTGANP